MVRTRSLRGAQAALIVLGSACSAPSPPLVPKVAKKAPIEAPHAPPRTGWFRYPSASAPDLPDQTITQTLLVEGRCFGVTSEGHRVLSASASCAGPWEAAVERLPPLAGVTPTTSGLAFVSETGQVFLASTPLGEVERPKVPAAGGRAVAGTALVVDRAGKLARFSNDWWEPVELGPGVSVDQVLSTPIGIFALGVPESLWVSHDEGRSFAEAPRTKNETIGAHSLAWDRSSGKVVVMGSLGRISRTAGTPFEADPSVPSSQGDSQTLGHVPHADRIGRLAVLDGNRYWELRSRGRGQGPGFVLVSGVVGEPLSERPLPTLADCSDPVLAARGHTVVVACHRGGAIGTASITGSTDEGATFEDWGSVGDAEDGSRTALAVLDEGSVAISHPSRTSIAVRLPAGPFRESPASPIRAFAVASDHRVAGLSMVGGSLQITFGEISEGGLDLGRAIAIMAPNAAAIDDLCSAPAFDKSGVLGVCIRDAATRQRHWVTITHRGQVAMHAIPAGAQTTGGAGMRLVVSQGGVLSASRDGGVSFDPIAQARFDVGSIACSDAACIFDDGLAWLGWESTSKVALEAGREADDPSSPSPPLGPTLACAVEPHTLPEHIDHIDTTYQPYPQLEHLGVDDALFEVSTEKEGGDRERVFLGLDGAQRRTSRARRRVEPTRPPRYVLGAELSAPAFARRTVREHGLSDGSSAQSELVMIFQSDVLGYRHVTEYAWIDPKSGTTHARTIAIDTQVSFATRGDELGLLLAPFRWDANDRSWDDASYRPIREDGELGDPIGAPSMEAFDRKPKRCTKSIRASTPRVVYAYGEPVSGALRRPVRVAFDSTHGSWGLVDGAVLQGTREAPCGVAVRATGAGWVAIVDGSLERGWLLVRTGDAKSRSLSLTPLSCKAEATTPPTDVGRGVGQEAWSTRTHPPGKL